MKCEENCVVEFHLNIFDSENQLIDSTLEEEPVQLVLGKQSLVPGVDEALIGKEAGAELKLALTADEAYGEYDAADIQTLPITMFEEVEDLEVGLELFADTDQGPKVVTVKEIDDGLVTIDGNHPLAGQDLTFEVKLLNVRPASAEELEHGHIH